MTRVVRKNIREAYSFIATNYEPGDEIFLIGFSRGAFTARSVAVSRLIFQTRENRSLSSQQHRG